MAEGVSFINTDFSNPLLQNFIFENLPSGDYKNVIIKPNWVKHEENKCFPIEAIVTDARLIEIIIEACLKKYKNIQSITIGDVPLQSCDWPLLKQQAEIDRLIEKYEHIKSPSITILDLRKEKWDASLGFMSLVSSAEGDPLGYSEIILADDSFLDPASDNSRNFRVSDYSHRETTKNHHKGYHRYLISNSILECDLFINVPKMKTHQKSGITGALKNLVGINGSKACLVHHQKGFSRNGGDEFPPNSSVWIRIQINVSQLFQKKFKYVYNSLRLIWALIKKMRRINTEGTIENINSPHFYIGSGSWYGNDSIWRMVYDLNNIILFAVSGKTTLGQHKARDYFCFLDGIVSGEGNGPLQPLPVDTNILLGSDNPFLIDLCIAKMMGYDYKKIPLLSNIRIFPFKEWSLVDPLKFNVSTFEGEFEDGLNSIPLLKNFIPPPGWRNHIELNAQK